MSRIKILSLVALLGATLSGAWAEDEKELTIDQVPEAVKAAILKAADGAKIEEIEQVKKGYEAEWLSADGKTETEITVSADGTVLKTESEAADGEDDDGEDGEDGEDDDKDD
jgi:hypothetical protein